MSYHMSFNVGSKVFSVCGKCLTVYKVNGEKLKSVFYKDIETAQKAFLSIVASFEA